MSEQQLKPASQPFEAEYSFATEYEGVHMLVHYDVATAEDHRGCSSYARLVAVTVGGHDILIVLAPEVERTLEVRARHDMEGEARHQEAVHWQDVAAERRFAGAAS